MKKRRLSLAFTLALTSVLSVGCATNSEYFAAVDLANQRAAEIAESRSQAYSDRVRALAELAASDDPATRTAAAMALAFSEMGETPELIVPNAPESRALQWASVLASPLTNLGIAYIGHRTSRQQIAANRDISLSTNESFVEMNRSGLNAVQGVGEAGSAALADISRQSINTIGNLAGNEEGDD